MTWNRIPKKGRMAALLALAALAAAAGSALLRESVQPPLPDIITMTPVYPEPVPLPEIPGPPTALVPEAPALPIPQARARIAIVIDDMGVSRRHSDAMAALDPRIALSFLPYAGDVQRQVDAAAARGHEIWLHLPMQPMGADNPGPDALKTAMPPEEIRAALARNLGTFTGYAGVNNHMGSAFTANAPAMAIVMEGLAAQGLPFLDSLTTNKSAARQEAALRGVPFYARDVFIDHEETAEAVGDALAQIERIAARRGSAIAIGHPKPETAAALAAWVPTLAEKGFILVPLSELPPR